MNYLKVVFTDEEENLINPINALVNSKLDNQEFTAIPLNNLKQYEKYIGDINVDSFYEPNSRHKLDINFILGLLNEGKQLYVVSNRFYYEDLKKLLFGLPVSYLFI